MVGRTPCARLLKQAKAVSVRAELLSHAIPPTSYFLTPNSFTASALLLLHLRLPRWTRGNLPSLQMGHSSGGIVGQIQLQGTGQNGGSGTELRGGYGPPRR